MPQSLNRSAWRKFLLVSIYLLPPAAMLASYYLNLIDVSVVTAFGVPIAIDMAIKVFFSPWLKRRWETGDKREATLDKRPFVLVLRPFYSPLVERRPSSLRNNQGTIVNDFCGRLQRLKDFSVVCLGEGEPVSGQAEPSEFVRIEPMRDRWQEVFAYLAVRCAAIIVIPDATNGCLRELKAFGLVPRLLRITLVWMPREQRRRVVATRWEANRRALIQHRFQLPPYNARGLLYGTKPDFSIDQVRAFTGRLEEAAVDEIRRIAHPGSSGLGEALAMLDVKG